MTKADQLEALALRCEQATRPDRELDLAIWRAVTGEPWCWHVGFPAQTVITWDRYGVEAAGNPIVSLDELTASLDAALTLVPDGYVVNLGNDEPIWAQVWIDNDPTSRGGGTTMALALCAAALRARAQMERGK